MSGKNEAQTKPTMETVLRRIDSLGENLQHQISSLAASVTSVQADIVEIKSDVATLKSDVCTLKFDMSSLRSEFQLFRGEMEIRIDRIEGMTNQTRAELLNLRADFREWRDEHKESMI